MIDNVLPLRWMAYSHLQQTKKVAIQLVRLWLAGLV